MQIQYTLNISNCNKEKGTKKENERKTNRQIVPRIQLLEKKDCGVHAFETKTPILKVTFTTLPTRFSILILLNSQMVGICKDTDECKNQKILKHSISKKK